MQCALDDALESMALLDSKCNVIKSENIFLDQANDSDNCGKLNCGKFKSQCWISLKWQFDI